MWYPSHIHSDRWHNNDYDLQIGLVCVRWICEISFSFFFPRDNSCDPVRNEAIEFKLFWSLEYHWVTRKFSG